MTLRLVYKIISGTAASALVSVTCHAQSAVIRPDMPGYPQAQYEVYASCAGEFLAKQDLLTRIESKLEDPYAKYVKGSYEKGVSIASQFKALRQDLKLLPGTLNHAAGDNAYFNGRKKYDDAANSSAPSQYNLFQANAKISQTCIDHYLNANTFVLTWKAAEKNKR